MTASRVFNNRPGVGPETRQVVLRVARELGYVPNLPARSLASGRSMMLALVVWDVTSPYFAEVIRGVAHETQELGYHLILHTSGPDQKHEMGLVASLLGGLTDGLVLVLPREAERYLELLSAQTFPSVLLDHRHVDTSLPCVRATNLAGAREAMQHLIELGHQRIGFITGAMDFGSALDRLRGYKEALEDAEIPFDPKLVCNGDFTQASGHHAASDLLALNGRPTAIFASNDLMAFGAMAAAMSMGLRIPEDVSVVGFDDVPVSTLVYPPLTTVRQPLFEMGCRTVDLLVALINAEPIAERTLVLPTKLIVRGTTRAPGGTT